MPPTREASEAELDDLMARLSEGEREAFTPLFRALHPRALRVAARRLGPARGDEVAQAALVKLFTRAASFTPGRPALPWFYAVVANEARAELRGTRHNTGAVPEQHPSPEAAADDAPAERERRRALLGERGRARPDLGRGHRRPPRRGGAPPIAPTTHRKRLSRAYARLRALLGGDP